MLDESRLHRLLATLSREGATDLHLKPGAPPRLRRKGVLEALPGEERLTRAVVDELALVLLSQGGFVAAVDGDAAVTYAVDGIGRFRVRGYHQRGSVALVVRRIPDRIEPLDELGLPDQVRVLAEEEHGLVLVVGPARSGRRRTLASMLDHVNHVRAAHVVAVEQPVELLHRDAMGSVSQVEVGTDTRSFGEGVQAALAADPDVVVVSDVADHETAAGLVAAAEDGLLVLAGMTAPSGVDAIRAFVDLFPEDRRDGVRLSLAGTLRGTIAQRLAPRACGRGRTPIVEIVLATAAVRECLFDASTLDAIDDLLDRGGVPGMQSFATASADLMESGVIDLRGALTAMDDWSRLHAVLCARSLLGT